MAPSPYPNLDDYEFFPTWRQIPSDEDAEYCFLAEIKHCDGFMRFRTVVMDLEGREYIVAFYPDSYDGFDFKQLKRGHTLAVFGAAQHQFLDGTLGVRVEDMDDVSVIPASLQVLRELGPEEGEYTVDLQGAQWKCHGCDASKPAGQLSRCGQCKAFAYCSKECQAKGWTEKNHKTTCKVLRARAKLFDILES